VSHPAASRTLTGASDTAARLPFSTRPTGSLRRQPAYRTHRAQQASAKLHSCCTNALRKLHAQRWEEEVKSRPACRARPSDSPAPADLTTVIPRTIDGPVFGLVCATATVPCERLISPGRDARSWHQAEACRNCARDCATTTLNGERWLISVSDWDTSREYEPATAEIRLEPRCPGRRMSRNGHSRTCAR